MIRNRSWCSLVAYPDNIDDGSGDHHWLTGWNAVTDLYKVLEATMDYAAARNRHQAWHDLRLPDWSMVRAKYDALPAVFTTPTEVSGNPHRDIYGFQLANLTCTLQVRQGRSMEADPQAVRMAIAVAGEMGISERCTVAAELLESLATIPTAYMQAISAPMVTIVCTRPH